MQKSWIDTIIQPQSSSSSSAPVSGMKPLPRSRSPYRPPIRPPLHTTRRVEGNGEIMLGCGLAYYDKRWHATRAQHLAPSNAQNLKRQAHLPPRPNPPTPPSRPPMRVRLPPCNAAWTSRRWVGHLETCLCLFSSLSVEEGKNLMSCLSTILATPAFTLVLIGVQGAYAHSRVAASMRCTQCGTFHSLSSNMHQSVHQISSHHHCYHECALHLCA